MTSKKKRAELEAMAERRTRHRPEASLHGSRSRAGGARNVPHGRVPGTNGSWPARGAKPSAPVICGLYDDFAPPEPEAVFGQYPRALIAKLLPWLRCARREVLHVCSGALRRGEGIRVDVRPEAHPDILADGRKLPLRDGSVAAVMLDPPYTEQYAEDLYGVEYPRPAHLLREAARVVRPGGRIAFVHYLIPMPPPGCTFVKVFGLSTGFGFPMRAVTLFERDSHGMFESPEALA